MSHREYVLTVVASMVGSVGALFWALVNERSLAAVCLLLAGWCTWRVFRYDLGER